MMFERGGFLTRGRPFVQSTAILAIGGNGNVLTQLMRPPADIALPQSNCRQFLSIIAG